MMILAVIGGVAIEHRLPDELPVALQPYIRQIEQGMKDIQQGLPHVSHSLHEDDVLTITREML